MKKEHVDKMSLQEAMDYSVFKIVEQGGQCLSLLFGGCSYGSDGKHCAIGWLLDEDIKYLMEYPTDITLLVKEKPEFIPNLIIENVGVFSLLQDFHDNKFRERREFFRNQLKKEGVNVDSKYWLEWVSMGVPSNLKLY